MAAIEVDTLSIETTIVVQDSEDTVAVAIEESYVVIAEGVMGPPGYGIKGDKGDPGLSGASYVHTQSVASSEWVVFHGLNRFPSLVVVDSAGDTVEGSVKYDSSMQITVTFSAPFGGLAYVN